MTSISFPDKLYATTSPLGSEPSVESPLATKTSGLWSRWMDAAWNVASGAREIARSLGYYKNAEEEEEEIPFFVAEPAPLPSIQSPPEEEQKQFSNSSIEESSGSSFSSASSEDAREAKLSSSAKRRQRRAKLCQVGELRAVALPKAAACAVAPAVPIDFTVRFDHSRVILGKEMIQNLYRERGEDHFVALPHINEAIKKILNNYKGKPDNQRIDITKFFRIKDSDRYLCIVAHKYPHSNPAIITAYYMDTSSVKRKIGLDGSSNKTIWETYQQNMAQLTGALPPEPYVWHT